MKFVLFILLILISTNAFAEDILVNNANELVAAIGDANAGDTITLADGSYDISNNISCIANGTKDNPITVRAETLGNAIVNFDTVEGFKVLGAYWVFENLEIHGICADDSSCEHAFHIKGTADGTYIHHNKIEGFNAHIKGGGTSDTPRIFSDDVVIAYNEFYSDRPRQTSNPVTPIDIVGGKRWLVSHNYIHDFEKALGNNISYAAFLKGNSSDGVFSHNLVVCSNLHDGGVRLGLSFGGGGTGTQFCEDGSCETEHRNGIIVNNIIANCSDVGIYINRGANTQILNNTLFNTSGIDIRFDTSTATLKNNLLDGRITERDGGSATNSSNVEQGDLVNWFTDADNLDFTLQDGSAFVDQGETINIVMDDFCRSSRDGTFDIGALEYERTLCSTTSPFHGLGSDRPTNNTPENNSTNNLTNNETNNYSNNSPNSNPGGSNGTNTGHNNGMRTDPGSPDDDGCSSAQGSPSWMPFILLALFAARKRKRK